MRSKMRDLHVNAGSSLATVSMTVESPVGKLVLLASPAGISGVRFEQEQVVAAPANQGIEQDHLDAAALQIDEYFAGKRLKFHLPLDMRGTKFQQAVWQVTQRVAFAERVTYGDIARRIGSMGAARAVGSALGANPVLIIVPCHRVVGAGGRLAGFSSGLAIKQQLLEHEAGLVSSGSSLYGR